MDVDTVIMSLGTSRTRLFPSTTEDLRSNKRKCIVTEPENGQTSRAGVFAELVMP